MSTRKLSSKEKKKVDRCIRNVQYLSKKTILTETNSFIKRQQLRYVLLMLGAPRKEIGFELRKQALDIINDWKPFKVWRLKRIIHGRRTRQ